MWLCPQQCFPNNLLQMLKQGTREQCSVRLWAIQICVWITKQDKASTAGSYSLQASWSSERALAVFQVRKIQKEEKQVFLLAWTLVCFLGNVLCYFIFCFIFFCISKTIILEFKPQFDGNLVLISFVLCVSCLCPLWLLWYRERTLSPSCLVVVLDTQWLFRKCTKMGNSQESKL